MSETPRQRGQRQRRLREARTGRPPLRRRLAHHALVTFVAQTGDQPWTHYLEYPELLAVLVQQAQAASFRGTRRATLEARIRAILLEHD